MDVYILTFLTLSGLISQTAANNFERLELIEALNNAINQAANQVSETIKTDGDLRHLLGHTSSINILNNKDVSTAIDILLKDGHVKGLSTIQGANENHLYIDENGQLAMTVNLQFDFLAFEHDYHVENNVDLVPESGKAQFVAYDIPVLASIPLVMEYINEIPKITFPELVIRDRKKVGTVHFLMNGKIYSIKEKNIEFMFTLDAGVIRDFAEQLVLEFADYLLQEIEKQLSNVPVFLATIEDYYAHSNKYTRIEK